MGCELDFEWGEKEYLFPFNLESSIKVIAMWHENSCVDRTFDFKLNKQLIHHFY